MDKSFFPVMRRRDGQRPPFIKPYSAKRFSWGQAVPT
jgi:hypothetical protein